MTVVLSETIKKQLAKLDKTTSKRVVNYLHEVEKLDNPRSKGKALCGNLRGFWRYRVGDYRVVCEIKDKILQVDAIFLGHRKDVYE